MDILLPNLFWFGVLAGFGAAVVYVCDWLDHHFPTKRKTPKGYVGRFRRPDGKVVHVTRLGGDLVVVSEEPVGVLPKDLGNVNGRELLTWHKLANTPDGRSDA